MARIRTVKPGLFTHCELYDAEVETKLPLRLSFIALFTCCDREGRFKWRPRELKIACLPFDNVDFSRVLDALTTRGFLVKYASPDGEEYGCIPTWGKHQVINNREAPSELPSPTETGVVTRDPRVNDASPTRDPRGESGREGKGREGNGKGKEGNGKGKEGKEEDEILFSESKWTDIALVKEKMPEAVTGSIDLQHYRNAILNWSDTNTVRRTERGWLATYRTFIAKDREANKLKTTVWNPRA